MDTPGILPQLRPDPSFSPRRRHSLGQRVLAGGVRGVGQLEDGVAQLGFTEEEQGGPTRLVGSAIVGGLAGHVGEVDPLAEHVPANGSFRRGDTKSLTEDTGKVGDPRSVPEETTILRG